MAWNSLEIWVEVKPEDPRLRLRRFEDASLNRYCVRLSILSLLCWRPFKCSTRSILSRINSCGIVKEVNEHRLPILNISSFGAHENNLPRFVVSTVASGLSPK